MSESTSYPVIIIGAGLSGIAAGYRLQQAGFDNYLILEKARDVGGTWRENTYPGCACDVPSALYSFSFNQKHDWNEAFASQGEILDYVRDTAHRFRIHEHIRFGVEVSQVSWNEQKQHWVIHTNQGPLCAKFMISCAGYLHAPNVPAIPGLETFKGKCFHSARWDHEYDLTGKRVAVIGTGASAIQFVPRIQPQVEQLHLFQRTAPWVLPKPNHDIPDIEKAFFKLPLTLNTWRTSVFNALEVLGIAFRRPRVMQQLQKLGLAHLKQQIPDPELRTKLTPNFTLGCKRMLLSNDYYPALAQSNVEVLHSGVTALGENWIEGHDGQRREVDAIIFGTGFEVTDPPIARCVKGRTGQTLAEYWQGSPKAYLGTVIHGFPNLFLILGPNLGNGHSSATVIMEAQLDYIIRTLKMADQGNFQAVEIKQQAQQDYNLKVQKSLQGTVWNAGGCSSYYIDRNGRNSIMFPWSTHYMIKLMRNADLSHYQCS